ncbi:MAG: hypothetical protein KC910_12685 [Candidatus Eremiobacteraeota bacterium]|nr:hypothetical protein [Candidatus Eremiobacteraeota bacterium]
MRIVVLMLLLAVPAWCDGIVGHWTLVEVDKARDPRWTLELVLEADGKASLFSQQTTEIRTTAGVKARVDEVELTGTYRREKNSLIFFWQAKPEAADLLEANFGASQADGSRRLDYRQAKQLVLTGPRVLSFDKKPAP